MGAAEISARGKYFFFQRGGLPELTQGGGLFLKLKMGREGVKRKKYSAGGGFWKNNHLKKKYTYKLSVFGGKRHICSIGGVQFLHQGGGLTFEGSAYGHPPSPPLAHVWLEGLTAIRSWRRS